jgi:hypothetical protein
MSPPRAQVNQRFASCFCAALTCTGLVWAYYSTIIQPQNAGSRALCAVNLALLTVNGYNVYRKLSYERSKSS